MEASTLAHIEFRQEIGTLTEVEREALVAQLFLAGRRIRDRQWETVQVADLSAPADASVILVPS